MSGDVYYNSVQLLLHGEGANNSTVFTDNSANVFVPTAVGTPKISTAVFKYGLASILFNGTTDALSYAHSANLNLATGDFTIEAFVQFTSLSTARTIVQKDQSFGTTFTSYQFQVTTAGALTASVGTGNGASYSQAVTSANGLIVTGRMYHVAFTREGTNLRLFIDGALVQTAVQSGSAVDGAKAMLVGRLPGGGGTSDAWMAGNIDELRITKGVARYTAAFTPPTAQFPDTVPIGSGVIVLAAPHPGLSAFGAATARFTAPHPSLNAFAGGTATLRGPGAKLAGSLGSHVALTGTRARVLAAGHDATGERAFAGSAPSPRFSGYAGANAKLRAPRAHQLATGTGTVIGRALLTGPSPALAASGEGGGIGSASLRGPRPSLRGYFGGVLSVTIGRATLQASGTAGSVGQAAVRAPLFELIATATRQNSGSALLVAPSPRLASGAHGFLLAPMARLVAIGSAVVVASYEAYSLNLNHKGFKDPVDELTRYTNFPFTHIVRYQNSYFGVAADGLYLLEGTTDFADPPTAVPWAWKTGISDFGSPQKKTLVSAYFGGRLGQVATVTQYIGEAGTEQYAYAGVSGPDAQNYRQRFGLGIKTRYQALGVAGTGELALDTIDFNIANLSRRI